MQTIRIEFPKVPWMPKSLSGSVVLVVELHVHTNVYAVYACGCYLYVTCQVALVSTIKC